MLECFVQHRHSFFLKVTNERTKKKFVITEFNSSFGIADAVIGTYIPNLNKNEARNPVDPTWVRVLNKACAAPGLDVDSLAQAYKTSVATAKKKVQQFLEAKLLIKTASGNYILNAPYRVIIKSSVAVEAKLRDWNRALCQARRYRKFANYSFVLLDEDYIHPAISNISKFKTHEIGLVSMGKKNVTIHYTPSRNTPSNDLYLYKLNEEANKYFKECLASS